MKRVSISLIALALAGCSATTIVSRAPVPEPERFQAAPCRIDKHIESATIEDYIIALPTFSYHEESEKGFWQRVRSARKAYVENDGKVRDFLFVKGDGTWPSKTFLLNRLSKTLTIRVHEWEPPSEGTIRIHTMRRVPGGWMRGPGQTMKNPAVVLRGEVAKLKP